MLKLTCSIKFTIIFHKHYSMTVSSYIHKLKVVQTLFTNAPIKCKPMLHKNIKDVFN